MAFIAGSPKWKIVRLTESQVAHIAELDSNYRDAARRVDEARNVKEKFCQELAGKDADWDFSEDNQNLIIRKKV
jgi:hypothetical protein